jgi:hypothetical protein
VSVCATKTRVDIKRHLIDGTFPGTHSRAWQKQRWKSVDEKLVTPALRLLSDRPDRNVETALFQKSFCEKLTTTYLMKNARRVRFTKRHP